MEMFRDMYMMSLVKYQLFYSYPCPSLKTMQRKKTSEKKKNSFSYSFITDYSCSCVILNTVILTLFSFYFFLVSTYHICSVKYFRLVELFLFSLFWWMPHKNGKLGYYEIWWVLSNINITVIPVRVLKTLQRKKTSDQNIFPLFYYYHSCIHWFILLLRDRKSVV